MSEKKESLEQQVIDLQSQLAFQEDTIRDLDVALAEQQRDILLLRRQLELLQQRQEEQAMQVTTENSVQEKPPHY
ncbi:SlyX family protein [Candidatus Marimicrobium litorale]|uniref:Protein SlyX homolog n=1 Tax=Candidatus Marimicrobium litorale TaxID=2518991 RepID=A0ABT3T405_9GAMM|nr:SlyX family protein [Candidatus Marimicrobium litorale]MCX2976262.1 SlyX protein [Candidatus Marimicrobium litorale]